MRNVVLLCDGMPENSNTPTSLDLAKTKHLDFLTNVSFGNYIPHCFSYNNLVETYLVFPHFFGLNVNQNPGRGGLELIEYGHDISRLKSFCIIRVVKNNFDPKDGWMALNKAHQYKYTEELINESKKDYPGIVIEKSIYSEFVYCLGARTSDLRQEYIHNLQYQCSKNGLICFTSLVQEGDCIVPPNALPQKKEILGYAVGPLLTALKVCGIHENQNDHIKSQIFNFEAQRNDFTDRVMSEILSKNNNMSILYFKGPSKAARIGNKKLKIQCIEFIDYIMGELLQALQNDDQITLLTDHQSNIGEEKSYNRPTIYSYGNIADIKAKFPGSKFHEQVANKNQLITQEQLKHNLYNFR